MDILTFYVQAKGASHIASNKPCQDSGLEYHEDGVYIAIVCDGHGGESYVRSHAGAKFAAEVAKEQILEFIKTNPENLLKGKKGSTTSVPLSNPLKDSSGNRRDFQNLSESEQDIVRQNFSYLKSSEEHPDIEKSFRQLFENIHTKWIYAIKLDAKENQLSPKEKEKLGGRQIEKAYGTTLMAAVRTSSYWFAFQIGDGKLLSCDKLMRWSEPVPWDCSCFLNVTTSLCDHYPVHEFRYAFDGTADFPIAFLLGSDGIDDTFIKTELLQKFYSQLLCAFYQDDVEKTKLSLEKHLAELSVKGSHDDMSIAAIIEKTSLPKAVDYYKIIAEVKKLNAQRDEKENKIYQINEQIGSVERDLSILVDKRDESARMFWRRWIEALSKREQDLAQIDDIKVKISTLSNKVVELQKELTVMNNDFDVWKLDTKKIVDVLRDKSEILRQEQYPPADIMEESDENASKTNVLSDEISNETINKELLQ